MPIKLQPITNENIHILVPNYIEQKRIIISSYEDMIDVYLSMLRAKYFFSLDKQLLRGYLQDLTYIYCPGDDLNKDKVIYWLESSDDEDDDLDDGSDEELEEHDSNRQKLKQV